MTNINEGEHNIIGKNINILSIDNYEDLTFLKGGNAFSG